MTDYLFTDDHCVQLFCRRNLFILALKIFFTYWKTVAMLENPWGSANQNTTFIFNEWFYFRFCVNKLDHNITSRKAGEGEGSRLYPYFCLKFCWLFWPRTYITHCFGLNEQLIALVCPPPFLFNFCLLEIVTKGH